MTARTTRPKATRTNYKKGLETREKILTAAEECVFELGMHRASSREVVRRSGVTFGVIQHHFGTYEAVLLAVVERASTRLSGELSTVEVEEGSPVQRLNQIAGIVWNYYRQPYYLSYLEIYLNLLRDPATSEATRREIIKIDDEIDRMWESLIVRVLGRPTATPALRRLLFGTMRGLAVSRWLNDGKLNFEDERALFVRAVATCLAP